MDREGTLLPVKAEMQRLKTLLIKHHVVVWGLGAGIGLGALFFWVCLSAGYWERGLFGGITVTIVETAFASWGVRRFGPPYWWNRRSR